MRVLVVDDEARIAEQLSDRLRAAGYAVDRAETGERADFLVRTQSYDAALLDLGLPNVDGLTVLRGWRASGLAMPVIVLTARGTWHDSNTMEVFIARLRRKLGSRAIETVRGLGYRLGADR